MMTTAMKEESGGGGWGPRVCDTCGSAACAVYCRAESAYLCAGCDARAHRGAWRHERVRVCEACERAPAEVACKADAASLCGPCDSLVHSANPLARRHHRLPILPLPAPAADEEDEAASWLLPPANKPNNANAAAFFADDYLDLVGFDDHDVQPAAMVNGSGAGGDSVVPCGGGGDCHIHNHNHNHNHGYYGGKGNDEQMMNMNAMMMMNNEQLGFDVFDQAAASASASGSYGYTAASIRHSVSVSSMDVSVVPDSAMSEMSISHPRPPKGTIDLFSGPPAQMPAQLTPLDREARVLRYREKKKNRKFEKTIRYASRKAYAETRPRIKGRFAKRTEAEVDVDQMFSTALMVDSGYGIVPSF